MLRLCSLAWSCSRKPNHSTLPSYLRQIQNFTSTEYSCETDKDISADVRQVKQRTSVNKNSLIKKNILQSPDSRHHMSLLADILECDETVIRELVSKDRCLLTNKRRLEKVQLLKDNGFSACDIIANPAALRRSLAFLQKRLLVVKSVPWPKDVSLNAIIQSDEVFDQFIEKHRTDFQSMESFASREQFLSKLFNCDEESISVFLMTNKLLITISPAIINSKMSTLIDKFQISHKFVRENSKILFCTSVKELDRRLTLLNEKQLLPPNSCNNLSYLLSCNSKEFVKSFNYAHKKKEALEGCKDRVEYICLRLQCNEATAKHFLSFSHIKKMSEIKLKLIIDFLLNEIKMEADFVLKHRELFIYSIKRIRERWAVLYDAGCRDATILPSVVVLKDKQFSAKFGSRVFVDTFNIHP